MWRDKQSSDHWQLEPRNSRHCAIAQARRLVFEFDRAVPANVSHPTAIKLARPSRPSRTLLARKRDVLVGPRISEPRDKAEARLTHAWANAIDEGLLP